MNKQLYIISDTILNLLQIFEDNKKILEKYVSNTYNFKGELNKCYRIKIISYNNCLITSFYISEKNKEPYIFNLKTSDISHKIFIKLLDQNYEDLKIEKGVISLEQKI